MRILIAEDEKDLNRILVSRLEAEHYSVDACFNGQEALEYLESAEYDAAVLDIMMPVMDGLSVLRKLREQKYQHAGAASDGKGQYRRPGQRTGCRRQ